MPDQLALKLTDLPANTKKTVTLGETKILLVRTADTPAGEPTIFALEAECPHAKAPLEKGAVCNGRLVCPFHTGTFSLETGRLIEPPPLRDLKRYPVRLAGADIFVNPEPLPAAKPTPAGEGKHLVFAGGGAATAAALAWLRDAGFAGTATVIDPELDEPVDRTQLTKMALAGKKPLEALPILPSQGSGTAPSPQQQLGPVAVQRVQAHVTGLDLDRKTVSLSTGNAVSFDALLLATGGLPRRLDVPGAGLPHVFTIRHTADLRRMEPLLQSGRNAVLIGDSFIAFEAASALKQRGLQATVVARSEVPFAQKFGREVAQAILALHQAKGVTVLSSTEAVEITPEVVWLKPANGAGPAQSVAADLVIVAIGVQPVVDYAPDSLPRSEKGGLQLGRNLRLAPQIWAAGDIAAVDGTRIEHWRVAEQHGRTAAEAIFAHVTGNAHGPAFPTPGVPLFWTTHFDKRFNYAGHADQWDSIEIEGDPLALNFLAFYVRGGFIAAVLGCGRDTAIAALMEPLRDSLTLDQAKSIAAQP